MKSLKFCLLLLFLAMLTTKALAGVVVDTTKTVFILNGKRVPAAVIYKGYEKASIEYVAGTPNHRDALARFGEMYRYGVFIYKTKDEGTIIEDSYPFTGTVHTGKSGHNQPGKNYHIEGTISEGFNGKYIMLFKFRHDSIFSVDTAHVEKGTFHFTGTEELNEMAVISCGNYPGAVKSANVFLENGNIRVQMNDSTSSVSGTPLNDLYDQYTAYSTQYNKRFSELRLNDKTKLTVEGSELNNLAKESYYQNIDLIKKNIKNIVGRTIFYDKMSPMYESDFRMLLEILPEEFHNSPQILGEISWRKEQSQKSDKRLSLVGTKYKDFSLITLENNKVKLSDYVGKSKFVFLDFWSSWCSPCIADVPHLKKVYQQYKDKGLQVVSVSLDTSIESWKRVIKRVDAPWIHLSDLMGTGSELTKAYGVQEIPSAFLIDHSGTIIQVNLRGESLGAALNSLLNK